MAPKFCPRCHQRVEIPDILLKAKVVGDGRINVTCGNCKRGVVRIDPAELRA